MEHLRFKSEQTAAAYVADELDPARREEFELHMMSCVECVEDVEGWRAIKNRLPDHAVPRPLPARKLPAEDRSSSPEGSAPNAESAEAARAAQEGAPSPATGEARKPKSGTPRPAGGQPPTVSSAAAHTAAPQPVRAAGGRWRFASTVAAALVAGVAGGWFMHALQGPSVNGSHIAFYSLPPLARGPADCMSLTLRRGVSLLALRIPGAVASEQLIPVDSEGHNLAPGSYSVEIQGDSSWLVRLPAATIREQGIRFEALSPDGTVEPRGCVISSAEQ